MGCGTPLACSDSLLGEPVRCLGGRDDNGGFFRCPVCRGRNYYALREGLGLVLREFRRGTASPSSDVPAWGATFLGCVGAALALMGLAKFITELCAEALLPYPPVALYTTFLAWAALYLISLVRSSTRTQLADQTSG
jgi:hypothetical protein